MTLDIIDQDKTLYRCDINEPIESLQFVKNVDFYTTDCNIKYSHDGSIIIIYTSDFLHFLSTKSVYKKITPDVEDKCNVDNVDNNCNDDKLSDGSSDDESYDYDSNTESDTGSYMNSSDESNNGSDNGSNNGSNDSSHQFNTHGYMLNPLISYYNFQFPAFNDGTFHARIDPNAPVSDLDKKYLIDSVALSESNMYVVIYSASLACLFIYKFNFYPFIYAELAFSGLATDKKTNSLSYYIHLHVPFHSDVKQIQFTPDDRYLAVVRVQLNKNNSICNDNSICNNNSVSNNNNSTKIKTTLYIIDLWDWKNNTIAHTIKIFGEKNSFHITFHTNICIYGFKFTNQIYIYNYASTLTKVINTNNPILTFFFNEVNLTLITYEITDADQRIVITSLCNWNYAIQTHIISSMEVDAEFYLFKNAFGYAIDRLYLIGKTIIDAYTGKHIDSDIDRENIVAINPQSCRIIVDDVDNHHIDKQLLPGKVIFESMINHTIIARKTSCDSSLLVTTLAESRSAK